MRNFEGRSGELVWERASRRQSGFRSLCVNREMTVLAHGDARTSLVAWNRTGDVVWEGVVLLPAKRLRLTDDNLLVSELWILKLTPEGGQS